MLLSQVFEMEAKRQAGILKMSGEADISHFDRPTPSDLLIPVSTPSRWSFRLRSFGARLGEGPGFSGLSRERECDGDGEREKTGRREQRTRQSGELVDHSGE